MNVKKFNFGIICMSCSGVLCMQIDRQGNYGALFVLSLIVCCIATLITASACWDEYKANKAEERRFELDQQMQKAKTNQNTA